MAQAYRNKMDKADTITKQLLQRQSDKNFRKRALDTLAVFESLYQSESRTDQDTTRRGGDGASGAGAGGDDGSAKRSGWRASDDHG